MKTARIGCVGIIIRAMRVISRRAFGQALMAAVPLPWLAVPRGGAAPAWIGVTTSAFRDLPRVTGRDNVEGVIAALHAVGATHAELSLHNVEPAPPSTEPVMGGTAAYPRRIVLTPEQMAATNAEARAALRSWRLETPATTFEDVRERFTRAGIALHSCSVEFDDSFTDAEIDATFQQVRALGLSTIGSPLTMKMGRRVAPIAERQHVTVAIHNQVDGTASDAIDTARLADALALSSSFALKLDVGRLTASNADVVAVVKRHRARISSVLLIDRLRNGGAAQPFGEGDTPLKDVLAEVVSAPAVPVFVGYDYVGLRGATEEIRGALAYLAGLSA
jgi:sugar phosphate isomerase/epimerase